MSKIKVRQIKSAIGRKSVQRKTLISLGLNKINRQKFLNKNDATLGMINRVKHLVETEEI